jgi:hypothetical protein
MIDRLVWEGEGTFASGHAEPQQLINTMIRHNREVEDNVPPERLLVWSVEEGWGRLCEFLEVPVPQPPFPHVNDRTEFLNRVIDGSLQALGQWRSEQSSVEPSFAVAS